MTPAPVPFRVRWHTEARSSQESFYVFTQAQSCYEEVCCSRFVAQAWFEGRTPDDRWEVLGKHERKD